MSHPERLEDNFFKQVWKWPAHYVNEQLLHDRVATARILAPCTGLIINQNRGGVCRRRAIENVGE